MRTRGFAVRASTQGGLPSPGHNSDCHAIVESDSVSSISPSMSNTTAATGSIRRRWRLQTLRAILKP